MAKSSIRIGAGAGFASDRWEPAVELIEQGAIDYIVFECLAERTIAREMLARRKDPNAGYNPRLEARMAAVLPACAAHKVRLVTNQGAANPIGAARKTLEIAEANGVRDLRCAVLLGDDVTALIAARPELRLLESGEPVESILPSLTAANAYLGADGVRDALQTDAQIVMTGRVADPSLFIGPMLFELGWSYDDYAMLGHATAAGHLLECAGQVTGGYFADPGLKNVPALARLGFPFADIGADGSVVIGKVATAGGRVDVATCTEQLIYEVHDPSAYITPDCVLDLTQITLHAAGPDRVKVDGARARPRTPTYKVSIGYLDGYLGEGQLSYGGPNAVARARLAGEIVRERLKLRGLPYDELRVELIGVDSLHGPAADRPEPSEVRLRVVGRTRERRLAEEIGWEVEALYTNGPSGGAGEFRQVRDVLAVQSVLLPRELVKTRIELIGSR